jgi:hypothetical protein
MLMGFRTPLETQHAYEAAKLLAKILDEFNAVRIIAVCDETASRDSFLFQVAQPELPDDHAEVDLTVATIGPSIDGDGYS